MKVKVYLVLAALFLTASAVGHARSFNDVTDTAVGDTSRVKNLDEVTVVAQPKEFSSLRNQPLSSTVYTTESLRSLSLNDLRDVSLYVPSFLMPNYGSRLTPSVYVRGIGSRVNSPAVTIYSDGMPILSKTALNTHFYGVERVDVLRGPQATLYGQNSEGGLIRIYTANPLQQRGTDVHLGLGTHFQRTAEASHAFHVSDCTAFSLSGFYEGSNGFFRNQFNNERADKIQEAGGRFRIASELSPRVMIDYIADYQYTRQNAFPYGVLEGTTLNQPSTNLQGNYRRSMFNTAFNVSAKGNTVDFFSTTSYQYLRDYMLMDQDYLPGNFMHLEQRQLQNGITQEFTLKSATAGRWHWSTGAYFSYQWFRTWAPIYFHEGFDNLMSNRIRTGLINQMVPAYMQIPAYQGMTYEQVYEMVSRFVQVGQAHLYDVPGVFHTPQLNLGLYHESDFDLTDRLTATLGLRYDLSEQRIRYATDAAMFVDMTVHGVNVQSTISAALNNKTKNTFRQLLPKLGLLYKLSDNGSNLFATVSKGYRAGGFNLQMFGDILSYSLQQKSAGARSGGDVEVNFSDEEIANLNETIAYKPEESWNYEVGTHLNLLDNSLQLDGSIYILQVKNQQLSVMSQNFGFGRMMTNAGKSESYGAEVALYGKVLDNRLSYAASYSYTHATFKEYMNQETVGGVTTDVDYKGKHVPFVPQHKFVLSADYAQPFKCFTIVAGANLTGNSRIYWDEKNTVSQAFYSLLGAHLDFIKGNTSITLWAKNLTDRRYATFAVNSAATGTDNWFAQRGNPVQVGIDLRFKL